MMINHCVLNMPCGSTNELFKSEQQGLVFYSSVDKEREVITAVQQLTVYSETSIKQTPN